MLDELKVEKDDMVKKRENLKKQYKDMNDDDPEKTTVYYKIKKIEDDLKSEYYKLLEDKGIDEPAIGKPKPPSIKSKQYQEEKTSEQK